MSRDINPFGLRMPGDLRERVEHAAAKSGRSLNAEILDRLQRSFQASADSGAQSELQLPALDAIKRQNEDIQAMLRQLLDRT